MKITHRQLRQIIKEEASKVIQETHSLERVNYEQWVRSEGHITPASSSVMASYFLNQGLESDHDLHKKLSAEFYMDHQAVMRDMEHQRRDTMSGEELTADGADYDEAGDLIDINGDGKLDADELRGIANDLEDDQPPSNISEAAMVSLSPIASRAPETMEARWAKLSGIPEEHINLNETIMDTTPMEDLMGDMAGEIADRFGNEMNRLWDEDPAMMREQGYTDKSQWTRQVGSAELSLEDELQQVMKQAVDEVETRLHDGQFHDDKEYKGFQKDSGPSDGPLDDEYPKTLGYKHPETGEQVMISVQSSDDMDDILDPLLRNYPELAYSID